MGNVKIKALRRFVSIKWEGHKPLDSTTGTVTNHNNVLHLWKINRLINTFCRNKIKNIYIIKT